jgi:hypothetical protein
MRHTLSVLLAPILILLAGCAGTQPYTSTDLRQVRQAYAEITPIYNAFKVAYAKNDQPAMNRLFAREQRVCRLVDTIDNRDSIGPNTNLFQASAYLDSFCNDIESAYSGWRQAHGLSYDKSLPKTIPGTYFLDGDYNMTQMARLLKRPAALCCTIPPPPTAPPTAPPK